MMQQAVFVDNKNHTSEIELSLKLQLNLFLQWTPLYVLLCSSIRGYYRAKWKRGKWSTFLSETRKAFKDRNQVTVNAPTKQRMGWSVDIFSTEYDKWANRLLRLSANLSVFTLSPNSKTPNSNCVDNKPCFWRLQVLCFILSAQTLIYTLCWAPFFPDYTKTNLITKKSILKGPLHWFQWVIQQSQ